MKYLFIFLLFFTLSAQAQEPVYVPMKSNYAYKGIRMDSLFILPNLDTAAARKVNGNLIRQSDKFYWYDTTAWKAFGVNGTSIDTTSLSNRINDKIDSIRRIGTQVSFKKNGTWYNAFIDSTGATNGFVPYTGATQDVDLGANGLNAKNIKVTGTAGNGHIDLKHQSGDATGQANSTKLYANSQGYLKWKNDNLYYSTLAMPQTADRVYTYQNKSYTLGDSADIAATVKYTDTATMLSSYLRKADTASLSNRINLKLNVSDTASMLSPYLRKVDTTSLSSRIDSKPNINPTTYWLPFNNGTGFSDSYLLADTPNSILKSQYAGNDIGLKLDFANDVYQVGNPDAKKSSLVLDGDISYIGDYFNNGANTLLTIEDQNQLIKTSNQGNDIGLKLDFANSDYNIGTSTKNFQIKDDSLKINGLIGQAGDSVVNISNSGKLGKVSITGKLNTSDSSIYFTKFRSDTMRTNIYATLNGKQATINGTGFVKASGTTISYDNSTYLKTSDTASMLTNYQRTSAFPVATFGAGSGAAGDTSAFSTSALYGSFYLNSGADTIIVTGYTGVVQGTSASVTPSIWFNDSLNVTAGGTRIVNSPAAVTSTTTGNTVTSLDNTKIPPGNFVWVTTGTVTTKPTYFNLTLIGYRKR